MIEAITILFEANRNESNAGPMKKYMKDHFPFLGIKSPVRKELMKQFFKESEILKKPLQVDFIQALWEKEEREYQYAAMDYLEKLLKKLEKEDLLLVEQLITTKSWWDTVDLLASKAVGTIAAKHPEVIEEKIEGWANCDDMWLRRTALLFQLKYKEKTNEELLYRYILQNNESSEFFIQKAIGWALREYSKTNPRSVEKFISGHSLPKLAIREGSKYL